MALRQLITESELKAETTISGNVESTLLTPFIQESGERHLKDVLGDDLWSEVLDQIEGSALSVENAALVAKIGSAAAWWCLYDALPFLRGRITNIGAVVKVSEHSQPMDYKSFENLRTEAGNRATEKTNRFQGWLTDNKADYPLYESYCKPSEKNYFSGIVFD
jgi:hypothetical protein